MTEPVNWGVVRYRLDSQDQELRELKAHIEAMERAIAERDKERSAQERKQLVAGISFLGAAVMTMLALVWSYRSVIIRGSQ